MNSFYVYAWTRPDTSEFFYIGKGRRSRDILLKRHNPIFMNIVDKLKRGGLGPSVERLHENLTEAEAFELEIAEIAKYGRRDKGGLLCNMTDGGEGPSGAVRSNEFRSRVSRALKGTSRSLESRAKMSAAQVGNRKSVGYSHTEEARKKIADSRIGKIASEETRQKISLAGIGRACSESTRSKRSESLRMSGPSKRNKCGYKGVSYNARYSKWISKIYACSEQRYLGLFPTPKEAALAYDRAAIEAWGLGNCYLNFPDGLQEAAE